MTSPVQIRPARLDDAAALIPLLEELGYPLSGRLVAENIRRLSSGPADRVWVAERAGEILGVASVHLTPLFHKSGTTGRITTLVVSSRAQGQGIGRSLVSAAETYCWQAGCTGIELTSGDHRNDAHRFYEHLGYHVRSRRFYKER
jgi:GNAT superfamily N-acetyltransferase